MTTEFWLRGAVDGVPPLLMPVAHALLQSQADLHQAVGTMSSGDLWQRPGSAASVGFHMRHIAGSLDRLFTYARGESLDSHQIAAISEEAHPGVPPATAEDLLALVDGAIDAAMGSLRSMPEGELLTARAVGRGNFPVMFSGWFSLQPSIPKGIPVR
jgi:hypothetical protein